jgi:hypothetical protein
VTRNIRGRIERLEREAVARAGAEEGPDWRFPGDYLTETVTPAGWPPLAPRQLATLRWFDEWCATPPDGPVEDVAERAVKAPPAPGFR